MNTSKTQFTVGQTKFFDETRYMLANRVALLFIAILIIVSITNSLNKHYNSAPDLIALAIILGCYVILRKTKNYRLVSQIAVVSASIILVCALFMIPGLHLSTPIWMLIVVIFTYLMLEKLWGAIVTSFFFGSLIIYLLTIFEDRINHRFLLKQMDTHIFLAEFTLQGISIGYMLHVFLKASQEMENHLIENQKSLTAKNELITLQKHQIEIMLKEIHHRIKNNLQIISSFLKLQADYDNNGGSLATYQEAVNRVNTIALIHEKIYKTDTFQRFELVSYFENLTSYICDSYPLNNEVRAYTDIEDFELNADAVVPLAMIMNELITNSIRHAFKNQPKPKISIEIKSSSCDKFSIRYSDNGHWVNSNEAFGSEIITAMTLQLNGVVERISTEEGTTYNFELSKT